MARHNARPWHLMPIGLLALLWHIAGVVDQTMAQFGIESYMRQFPPDWVAYFGELPTWVAVAWGAGAWLGLLGTVLLMIRDRNAVLALAGAGLGMIVASVWFLLLSSPTLQTLAGPEALWVVLAACAVPVLLWLYARRLKQRGVFGG